MKTLKLYFLVAFVGIVQTQMPKFLQAKYGTQLSNNSSSYSGTKTFTKTKTKTRVHPSAVPYSYATPYIGPLSKQGSKYRGGCSGEPARAPNTGIRCSQYSGCKADCMPNYRFPNGATQLFVVCKNGRWEIEGTEWDVIPACQPVCLPPCQNNGICVEPNQCNCPDNFLGPQCQFENKPCLNYPPVPVNSKRTCNLKSNTCTISCLPGHKFPDGSAITNLACKDGFWVPAKDKWKSVPDCLATCSPPCQNGGVCLSFNVCQCPPTFRGPQCQYSVEACNVKKLIFNGGYNCSGDRETFSCSLECPEGVEFEFPPESRYTCSYAVGQFLPAPQPQCLFSDSMEIIPEEGSFETSMFQVMNTSGHNSHSASGLHGLGVTHFPEKTFNVKPLGVHYPLSHEFTDESNVEFIPVGALKDSKNMRVLVEQKLPEPGICFTWSGTHYKTFDGKVYSFNSKCAHTLVRDGVDNTFSIVVQNAKECYQDSFGCYKIIKIYFQNKEYTLKRTADNQLQLSSSKKILPIPAQLPGLRVEMSAHYVVVFLDTVGAKLKWDGQQLVQVEVKESLWNRTEGLCGKIDGDQYNDLFTKEGFKPTSLVTLANSWKVSDFDEECPDLPTEEHACPNSGIKGSKGHNAQKFCNKLIKDPRFKPCHKVMDVSVLLDACRWDYCSCTDPDPSVCACETMNVYVRGCAFKSIKGLAAWRDEETCPMKCTGGRIYKPCGPPKGQPVCGAASERIEDEEGCVEGCYCPDGTVLHENRCITKDQCPCRLRGKSFPPGTEVPKDCNTCTCSDGEWACTQVSCGARCAAIGDPHYITFDGKKFDFMGQCTYYLVKTDKLSIEAENVACAGSISEAMNLPTSVSSGLPSCTKTVTIRYAGQTIKLKQNHDLVVNGQDITKVPYHIANIVIRTVSSIFIQVELPNGVTVWWDGVTRVYVDIPANFEEKTKGLCGTFNHNQKDDFLTPENDVEQGVIPFANKWKTSEKCNDVPDKLKSHPCSINIHHKPAAEKHCQIIKSDFFEKCHWIVDPDPYYQDCLYDMCSCEFKSSKCLCPVVAAYAEECSRKGVKIDWRTQVRECGVHCPGGQKYQVCGNTCTRTCQDIALRPKCRPQCVEGCNCPEGEALDDTGECVPIGRCKCQHDGLEFHAGYKEVRPASKGPELCTCVNANWNCRPARDEEIKRYPKASDLKSLCSVSENMEFTTCEPAEPITCKNMHSPDYFSATVCHPGCKCKEGYVFDSSSKKCVLPINCPCHHGGKSYRENETVQSDCNTCKCQNGKWKCTDRPCSAECSAWGDSHFKTFDGRHYDYQGQCDYVLAKGSLGGSSFDISIQNVPCGSLGTSCSKAITVRVKSGGEQETITLNKDKPLPSYASLKHLTVRQIGLYVIVEAIDMGLVVQWDQGTRVYVKVDPRWKDKVRGLCGNYNDNDQDDFQTPSGGMTEVSTKIFGDSWKLQLYCPEALEITNTCEDRPDRKVWALKKCGVLKSPLFAPCHSEVPIDDYLEKCVFDACACDQGGDCECLCTALAAYAQECNNRGVPIKWRSQKLCPMQCDERCSNYSPCISTCPLETCDNLLVHSKLSKSCKEDTCVEGCVPKPCPPDHVYVNSSFVDCMPRNVCKPVCLEIGNVTYYEGDLIEEDECHRCFCSRQEKICKGQPCTTPAPPSTTPAQLEQLTKCQSGWTQWINQDKAPISKTKTTNKMTDVEPLPSSLVLNNLPGAKCDVDKMINIECRTVNTHIPPKQTGLDVECSLEKGLVCVSSLKGKPCKDFEIRVLCQCEEIPVTHAPKEECDIARPHKAHPTDCHLFYHCEPSLSNGPHYVQKTCGPHMYFNPVSMTCDWPHSVAEIRPQCKRLTTAGPPPLPSSTTTKTTTVARTTAEPKTAAREVLTTVAVDLVEPQLPDEDQDGYVRVQEPETTTENVVTEVETEPFESVDEERAEARALNVGGLQSQKAMRQKMIKKNEAVTAVTEVTTTETEPYESTEDEEDVAQARAVNMGGLKSSKTMKKKWRKKNKLSPCPPGMVEDECAIECDRMCLYYNHLVKLDGQCLNEGVKCVSGCVSAEKKLSCPPGMKWANNHTCVAIHDCLCRSHDGKPIKPGTIHRESDCIVCQCIDNYYACDDSACFTSTTPEFTPTTPEVTTPESITTVTRQSPVLTTTVTPPEKCDEEDYVDLMQGDQPLPDEAFNASSVLSPAFKPEYSRFKNTAKGASAGSWVPEFTNAEQYLQIDLGRQEPLYGIRIKGSPLYDEYVTSYKVFYSDDGENFSPVRNKAGLPQVFRGSIDAATPVQQIFDIPFEAQFVRINPQTWHQGIALRVELIGCGEHLTTTTIEYETTTLETTVTTPEPLLCDDPMGFADGTMSEGQVSVSSELDKEHDKMNLNISGEGAWQPLMNSPTEFVQFDFLEPRNITGFESKGGPNGWVTAFNVKYSHNDKDWNPIIDKKTAEEKLFLGNFDKDTSQTNHFDLPIGVKQVKIIPKKWHKNIQLRLEIHGCFEPYPQPPAQIIMATEVVPPVDCHYCPGVAVSNMELEACRCPPENWWDGENCVNRTECPCMVGHIPYAVGTVYEQEDCSECLCKIGGVPYCNPKRCDPCKPGLRSTITSTCKCTCQPCPENTKLCPTSNICIDSTLWCNGVQDCPDDETDCTTTVITTTTTTTTAAPTTTLATTTVTECPVITCPPGFRRELRKPSKVRQYHSYLSPMFSSYAKGGQKRLPRYTGIPDTKTGVKGGVKRPTLQRPVEPVKSQNLQSPVQEEKICPEYRCVSTKLPPKFIQELKECPAVSCPLNYVPMFDGEEDSFQSKECPRYTCNPPPPPDAVCNITGRTFNTFDETEYKYDICDHVIARDLENDEWHVELKKNCTESCTRDLIIRHQDHTFVLRSDFNVEYDGYKYSVDQTKKIGTQTQDFSISRLGNTLLFVSNKYGIWIIWDKQGNVKLGAVWKLKGKIDGLCGYFNGNPRDDKRKPDGSLARTTVDFGDSWAQADQPLICETKTCPMHIQNKAWEICNKVNDQILAPCVKVVDVTAFVSRCMETTCDCLQTAGNNHTAEERCRCDTLQSFVVDCLTAEPTIELMDWRTQMYCPASCDSPLVYHDCYQRRCEPTCESISDPSVCPKLPHVCFPGCYCPPGYVKKGDSTCIKPSNCRDCECNVLPHLQYVTYDESNFTVNGNCVYVMSRDVLVPSKKGGSQEHKFQVLITNAPCPQDDTKSCVGKVTVLYQGHKMHILTDPARHKLKLIVDGERIENFDDISKWTKVQETPTKHLRIILTDIQVEVSVYYPSLGVSVKAPSHKYGGNLEGLCGDCNRLSKDDLKTPDGKILEDENEFALSWLYEKLPGGQSKEMCSNKPKEECPPLPADSDPCLQMLDVNKFGQCLPVVDPTLFVEWCRKDVCGHHPHLGCGAIEAYARDCADAGFCVNWRTDLCPAKTCANDKVYDPCGTSCPRTCESVKQKERSSCGKNVPVEGCFCPEGKVLLNDTCVIENDCEVCDDAGHHPGDVWKKDKCTTCTCKGTALKCETQHCSGADKICQTGYQAVKVPTKEDECCDKYACLPEPTSGPTCETPQKIICGTDQVLRLDTKPGGCQQFVCQCKPTDECEPPTTDVPLEEGYVYETYNKSCCPTLEKICKPELCPRPKPCEQYHSLRKDTVAGKCCPLYSCEPPKDKCIYENEYTAAEEGGERPRTKFEKQKVLKKANETWHDGPCRECKCTLDTKMGNYQHSCTRTDCPPVHTSQDFLEYEVKPISVPNQCCPNTQRVACKFEGENRHQKVYKVGETWHKGEDYCTTFECVNGTNGVQKTTKVTECETKCELGSEYVPAEPESRQCCGSCKPYACVVDGSIHKVGDKWHSPDFCTDYSCRNVNGSLQVQSVLVNCPDVPKDYLDNYAFEYVKVEGQCCKNMRTTACKVEGRVYHVGESWPSPDGDKCKNITCVDRDGKGEVVKQESVEVCKKDCEKGWKYEESSTACCGRCIQWACVVDGVIKEPGENWTSADNCTVFACEQLGDQQFTISVQQESCPALDNCPEENTYVKGCCKHCNITSMPQKLCAPMAIAIKKTIGLISANRSTHGNCVNKKPIVGFMECLGNCRSSTLFNLNSGTHESDCSCCQATKYGSIDVELECEDGFTWKKKIAVPTDCGCEGCAAAQKKNYSKSPTKTFVKS